MLGHRYKISGKAIDARNTCIYTINMLRFYAIFIVYNIDQISKL